MSNDILIAPSVLSADFTKLTEEIKAVENAGADWLHVDVMDGHFVPNITMGPFIADALHRISKLPLDCHLMIQNPDKYVERFVEAGAEWVSVHPEADGDIKDALKQIRKLGAKPALAVNPPTNINVIKDYLGLFDMLLIMTVNPGFSGQKLIKDCLPKYAEARKICGDDVLLEIDGGVKPENAEEVRNAGAQVIVAATAIFKSSDYFNTIQQLRGK